MEFQMDARAASLVMSVLTFSLTIFVNVAADVLKIGVLMSLGFFGVVLTSLVVILTALAWNKGNRRYRVLVSPRKSVRVARKILGGLMALLLVASGFFMMGVSGIGLGNEDTPTAYMNVSTDWFVFALQLTVFIVGFLMMFEPIVALASLDAVTGGKGWGP